MGARIGRRVIERRGNDSRDDRCGEIFGLMVRLPVLGKGVQCERGGRGWCAIGRPIAGAVTRLNR